MDAKPRELYLLFRAYDGYENSQLKVTSKNGKTTSVCDAMTPTLTYQEEWMDPYICPSLFLSAGGIRDVRDTSQR